MFDHFLDPDASEPQTKEKKIIENSFWIAAEQTGIKTYRENIIYMRGWPILLVFETLCNKLMPYAKANEIQKKTEESYSIFRKNIKLLSVH